MKDTISLIIVDECGNEYNGGAWRIPFDQGVLTDDELDAMKDLYLSRARIPEEATRYYMVTDYHTKEYYEEMDNDMENAIDEVIADGLTDDREEAYDIVINSMRDYMHYGF